MSKKIGDLAKDDVLGQWTLVRRLGIGGNGQVWEVINFNGEVFAIKVLNKKSDTAYKRFCDEVKIMKAYRAEGVVPIVDDFLPEKPNENYAWYVMPIGVSLMDYLANKKLGLENIIIMFVGLANALIALHARRVTHRDIKPANILILNNKAYLGDFGLVDYPDKADLTGPRENLGPRWTMAPEIRRYKHDLDTRPADVFSLAKSLWIAITGISEGFDGRYDGSDSISIKRYVDKKFIEPLEEILIDATEHDPLSRLGMRELRDRLSSWLELVDSFEKRNTLEWKYAQKKLFPICAPQHAEWMGIEEIISVLNIIGPKTGFNHLFFPRSGGLDLEQARASLREEGCIELITDGLVNLIRPKSLQFENFSEDTQWNYFRLECDILEPSGVYEECFFEDEEVLDLGCGQYIDLSYWDYNEFNGEPLPEEARPISRYFSGSFVIFQKSSIYNRIPETYDGRHSKMSSKEFREHVGQMINYLAALKE